MHRIATWMKLLQGSLIVDRFLYGYLIPVAVAFLLLAVGVYFALESVPLLLDIARGETVVQQPEIAVGQQLFKDVLQTVLAVAALAIAAFGYGTYKILSSQIEEKVWKDTERRYQLTTAYHRVSLAYVYWLLYQTTDERTESARIYLNAAINHTRRTYNDHVSGSNRHDAEFETLACQIVNNLAYYVSEEHHKFGSVELRKRAECLSFVAWLEERINNHPAYAHDYLDTVETVRRRFSTTSDN